MAPFSLCHINSMATKNRDEYYKAYYLANKARYAARSKAWREANPDRANELSNKWKANNRDKVIAYCERTKEQRNAWQRQYEATRRDPEKRKAAVRKWQAKHGKTWRKENQEYLKASNVQWRKDNAEHLREYKKSNSERDRQQRRKHECLPDRIERRRETQRECYLKNPGKRRANHKKWFEKNGKKYREENRGRLRAYSAKYKAVQLKATPKWSDLKAIMNVYDEAARLGLEVDHIIPLQGKTVCGLHIAENLQLLTRSQNRSKGNRYEHKSESSLSVPA